jgi:hypothetical protein
MLAERLETLKALADNKASREYRDHDPEKYGYANGLRCAVAIMTGVEYQPFLPPEQWLENLREAGL